MLKSWFSVNPLRLSIIINVYNMQREVARTLHTLTPRFQQGIEAFEYEVIVVDNGSRVRLDDEWVGSHGENFHYHYINDATHSPVAPLNMAASQAQGEYLLCCIDGARMLSPNILQYALLAAKTARHPFIYTLGMMLGSKPQNLLVNEGYNQQIEDQLLNSVDWQNDPYQLFRISSLALSSRDGYFSEFAESNAFCLKKADFLELGGFDERFQMPGGGLVNLDFFNQVHNDKRFQPILLLGEATFHQFHGGVATNVTMDEHPWESMEAEYKRIHGKPFASSWYPPRYFGELRQEAKYLYKREI